MSVCLSVCVLSVPLAWTQNRIDWRLLVKEVAAKITKLKNIDPRKGGVIQPLDRLHRKREGEGGVMALID